MTPILGNLFLHAAREPLSTSSDRFIANFLGDGVRESKERDGVGEGA